MATRPVPPVTQSPSHHNTIILGAGISGLACASKLSSHPNFQSRSHLLVLEARDRIGGRVESIHVNGSRLDTGANWIHGVGTDEHPNPLVNILPKKKMRELRGGVMFRPALEKKNWLMVDKKRLSRQKDEELILPPEIAAKVQGSIWGLMESLHESANEMSAEEAKQATILRTIQQNKAFKELFEDMSEDFHDVLKGLPQFVEGMEAGPLEHRSREHSADHPGMSMLEYKLDDFDGEQVFLEDGYTPLVNEVAKDLSRRNQIDLGAEVNSIEWEETPMKVRTSKGVYTAERVICTLPLGVLQHHEQRKSLFTPSLPQEKREAITSLGFGTLDKVFLVYSSPWWKLEPYLSVLKKGLAADSDAEPDTIWGFTTELPGLAVSPSSVTGGPRALFVINLHSLTGFPVLSTFVSCANAVHVESLSNIEAADLVHSSLAQWLGIEPPRWDAVHVTRWRNDPYTRGSYSHMIAGISERKHRE
jgi:N1-acetylpolyamine oxidase